MITPKVNVMMLIIIRKQRDSVEEAVRPGFVAVPEEPEHAHSKQHTPRPKHATARKIVPGPTRGNILAQIDEYNAEQWSVTGSS